MSKYQSQEEIQEGLQKRLINEITYRLGKVDATKLVAADLFDAMKIAEIFGFANVEDINVAHGHISATYRNLPDCHGLLPLFEFLDSRGFEATSCTDYPTIKNRDFYLTKEGVTITVCCYFTDKNCRKVPVATTTTYRLECGVTDENQEG